ncbi:MAG: uroporphyrinogen decarboxylase family protein [Sedimentisphaerales bacterium]
MTPKQWNVLVDVINGKIVKPLPIGFIIDSPWLPGWSGITAMEYYFNPQMWLDSNFKAINTFPEVIFLPGFWSEYGMCTEPSAFGAKCSWDATELPFAHPTITDIKKADTIVKPDPAKDGLLPFTLLRLKQTQKQIESKGHNIKFAISRGPLNIASFLAGTTEFLMGIRTDSDIMSTMLNTITDFIIDWLRLQAQTFPTIDGIFVLDDIVGFLSDHDFIRFAKPWLKKIFNCLDVNVKFFHNDARGLVCAPHLAEIGINLFNFSHEHSLTEMRKLCGDKVTLLGNVPPRDVLALGTPDEVTQAVRAMLDSFEDRRGLITSCGGGIPQNVPTENIKAFIEAVQKI